MTSPLPPLPAGFVFVAPASPKGGAYGEGAPSLLPGQAIYFRVLPAQASGEVRLRIGAHTLTAAGQRPLPEGASGTAVVRSLGPPVVLQITELRSAAAPDPVRLPVLMGRESLGNAAPLPQAFLAKWNGALKGNMSPDAVGASPERLREGILLSRVVVSALVMHAGGEAVLKRLTGMHRPAQDAGIPQRGRSAGPAAGEAGTAATPGDGAAGPDGPGGATPGIPGRPIAPEDLSARAMSAAPVGLGKPAAEAPGKGGPDGAPARPDAGAVEFRDGATALPRDPPESPHVAPDDAPFWFFIPFPGEKAPVLFPGCRRRSRGEKDASWNIYMRLPDLGAVSVRFQPGTGGWKLEFAAEHEGFARALIEGSGAFAETLRARGIPVRDVVVRRVPGGEMEAQVGAALSADLGLPLVEKRA